MTISIIGYYDTNFGDLLMLKGIIDSVPRNVNEIYILTYSYAKLDLSFINSKVKLYPIQIKNRRFSIKLLRALLLSKYIIWGGGSCFNLNDKGTGALRWMSLFRFFGARVIYYGIAIELDKESRILYYVRRAIDLCSKFYVRDQASFEISKQFSTEKVYKVCDPIYLNNLNAERSKTAIINNEKTFLICYRDLSNYFSECGVYFENFKKAISCLIDGKIFTKILVFVADEHVDADISYTLYNYILQNHKNVQCNICINSPLIKKCELIRQADTVITARLHVGVYASFFGIDTIFLNYAQKNENFVRENNIRSDRLVSYEELSDETIFLRRL